MDSAVQFPHWQAYLKLDFSVDAMGKTRLSGREHTGPLVVQRPFYPEQATCHVYVLHPPGGIAGGDQLHLSVNAQQQAHCLITTPAANKFYRSDGPTAVLQQRLYLDEGSVMEWLPQETIFFEGCRVNTATQIHLAPGAKFIGWEISCLGRPTCKENFEHGVVKQGLEIWQNEQPRFIERALFEGNSKALTQAWGLNSYAITATMLITPATKAELAIIRENVQASGDDNFSATLINDILVLRYLGRQAEAARQCFTRAWQALRPLHLGKTACIPRIWNT